MAYTDADYNIFNGNTTWSSLKAPKDTYPSDETYGEKTWGSIASRDAFLKKLLDTVAVRTDAPSSAVYNIPATVRCKPPVADSDVATKGYVDSTRGSHSAKVRFEGGALQPSVVTAPIGWSGEVISGGTAMLSPVASPTPNYLKLETAIPYGPNWVVTSQVVRQDRGSGLEFQHESFLVNDSGLVSVISYRCDNQPFRTTLDPMEIVFVLHQIKV